MIKTNTHTFTLKLYYHRNNNVNCIDKSIPLCIGRFRGNLSLDKAKPQYPVMSSAAIHLKAKCLSQIQYNSVEWQLNQPSSEQCSSRPVPFRVTQRV